MGSISGPGPKILHALGPKTKTIKQKQYCNKFDKELKKIQSVQACGCWTVKVSQSVCDWPTLISRQPWEVGVSFLLIPGKQGLRETEVLPGCFTAGTDLYGSRDLVLSCFPFLSVLNYMWHAIYYTILPIFTILAVFRSVTVSTRTLLCSRHQLHLQNLIFQNWNSEATKQLCVILSPSGIHHPTFHRCDSDSSRSLKLMKSSAFKLWNGKGAGCNIWEIFLLCRNAVCPIFLGWRKSLEREREEESWGLGVWSLHPSVPGVNHRNPQQASQE